jgi:hypothetical protein
VTRGLLDRESRADSPPVNQAASTGRILETDGVLKPFWSAKVASGPGGALNHREGRRLGNRVDPSGTIDRWPALLQRARIASAGSGAAGEEVRTWS